MKSHRYHWLLAATASLAAAFAHADTVVIEAAQYLDVVQGRLVAPAVIVVEGEKITAINPATRPANARTIDLGGQTLLPGLMDSHTHLNYDIVEGWETEPVRFTAGDYALRGTVNARKTLLAGFTTVRDLGTGLGFSDVALQRAIDQGWVIGPRMIPAGHALSITGGHCDLTGFGPGIEPADYISGVADGVDEVLKAARYQIKHGAKVIKICATAGVLSFEGPAGAQQYPSRNCARPPRKPIVMACGSRRTPTARPASSPRARPESTASSTTPSSPRKPRGCCRRTGRSSCRTCT